MRHKNRLKAKFRLTLPSRQEKYRHVFHWPGLDKYRYEVTDRLQIQEEPDGVMDCFFALAIFFCRYKNTTSSCQTTSSFPFTSAS